MSRWQKLMDEGREVMASLRKHDHTGSAEMAYCADLATAVDLTRCSGMRVIPALSFVTRCELDAGHDNECDFAKEPTP